MQFGNDAADKLAKDRREAASVPASIVEEWQRLHKIADQSLRRMGHILLATGENHQRREPGAQRTQRSDITARAQARIQSGHLIPQKGVRRCAQCFQVAPAAWCTGWMRANACPGQPTTPFFPAYLA